MNKRVNGKQIDIPNIDLFNQAFEGMALANTLVANRTDIGLDEIDTDNIREYIKEYDTILKSLPFPLYAIEENIKYAVLGSILKIRKHIENDIWVNKGLYIKLDDQRALRFMCGTWGIVGCNSDIKDSIDLNNYKNSIGYEEFKWAYNKLKSNKSLAEFYTVFMKDFVSACNKQSMVLKWELSNILNFGPVPKEESLPSNKIIDLENETEYRMDIYYAGKRKTGESETIFTLGDPGVITKPKFSAIYDYDVYSKSIITDKLGLRRPSKSRIVSLDGFRSLYDVIVSEGEEVDKVEYSGVTLNNKLLFTVNGVLYVSDIDKYTECIEIGTGLQIVGHDRGYIYIKKNQRCSSGITKESIYAFNPVDMQLRLCRIRYY